MSLPDPEDLVAHRAPAARAFHRLRQALLGPLSPLRPRLRCLPLVPEDQSVPVLPDFLAYPAVQCHLLDLETLSLPLPDFLARLAAPVVQQAPAARTMQHRLRVLGRGWGRTLPFSQTTRTVYVLPSTP